MKDKYWYKKYKCNPYFNHDYVYVNDRDATCKQGSYHYECLNSKYLHPNNFNMKIPVKYSHKKFTINFSDVKYYNNNPNNLTKMKKYNVNDDYGNNLEVIYDSGTTIPEIPYINITCNECNDEFIAYLTPSRIYYDDIDIRDYYQISNGKKYYTIMNLSYYSLFYNNNTDKPLIFDKSKIIGIDEVIYKNTNYLHYYYFNLFPNISVFNDFNLIYYNYENNQWEIVYEYDENTINVNLNDIIS